MNIKEVLHSEANKSTAAIMHLLEANDASNILCDVVRKKIGDILHSSKRRIVSLLEEE